MNEVKVSKVRPAELRCIAAQTQEPERARKMLWLAEQLEEAERATHHRREGRRNEVVISRLHISKSGERSKVRICRPSGPCSTETLIASDDPLQTFAEVIGLQAPLDAV